MSCCANRQDLCVVRGDTLELVVMLNGAWDEVAAAPADFVVRLVFQERLDDDLPEVLVLTETPAWKPGPAQPWLMADQLAVDFTATPAQTQALPDWEKMEVFCELRKTNDSYVKRLFEGDVILRD